ncbi:MAG: enoyl-CoA hydratase/isomerase family protein [Gemmatimonadales bacterium]|jgi:methylglutaconyl-CoA hydratase|nr:enoyl-CoA hydratase/isomerase family protein [Gemmatimonadales bacterium]
MSDLRLERADGVLTLVLDRPAKRNALSLPLVEAMHVALDAAALDPDVRVVALRGAGRDFCAGADLDELLASADRPPEENERDAMRLGALFMRLRQFPRPVVAVVAGRALAGGAGLATACDLVLCSASAQLGYPEMQRGFVPAMVMTLLRRLVGERRAFELVATGRLLSADEALALGLVTRVVPDAELDATATDLLRQLAEASPSAMHLTKRLFYELDGRSFDDGIALGARVNALARTTPEFRAAIARFLAR